VAHCGYTSTARKDSFAILLDKISRMREELLTIERALEWMKDETAELPQDKSLAGKIR
jgi:hypothetical protein